MKQVIHSCLFLTVLVISSFVLKQEEPKALKVRIDTPYGPIIGVLYNDTPLHRDNFAKNIKDSVYKDLLFHRVIKDFMIQGGDPDSRNAKAGEVLGNGGLKYTVPAEFTPKHFHKRGAICAARTGDQENPKKASSSTQFYIVQGKVFSQGDLDMFEQRYNQGTKNNIFSALLSFPEFKAERDSVNKARQRNDRAAIQRVYKKLEPEIEKEFAKMTAFKFSAAQRNAYTTVGGAPHLDGAYTVFGEVISGMEYVDSIAKQQVDGNARPFKDLKMNITLINE